jgi:hypothetical protein
MVMLSAPTGAMGELPRLPTADSTPGAGKIPRTTPQLVEIEVTA